MTKRTTPRRRRIAPVVAVILLVVAVKLLSVGWFSRAGVEAFEAGDYDASATDFGRVELVNVVESWKAPFDRGVALYRSGDVDGAEAAFRRAQRAAPERCDVLTNLVLTIETAGDRLVADGDRDAAHDRYVEARAVAGTLACPIPDGADDRDPAVVLDAARRRLDAKLAGDPSPPSTTEPDDSQSTSTTTTTVAPQPDESPSAPTAEQQAQLDELADKAATKNNEQSGDEPETTRPDSGGW